MTQRNLKALRAKSTELQIDDITLKIEGLTFPEMTEFAQIGERDKNAASAHLVKTTLRKALPESEVSKEEFEEVMKNLSADASIKIINTVVDLSGLGDGAKK